MVGTVLNVGTQEALGPGTSGNSHARVSEFSAKNSSLRPQQQNKGNDPMS